MSPSSDPNFCELTSVYALQALPANDVAVAEAHIASCPDCRSELESLWPVVDGFVSWPTDVLRPTRPLQDRLALRIAEETGTEPVPPPARQWREPDWEPVAPGIDCKLLAADTERHRISMLVRLAPGASYPPHTHAGVEELHLLAGELWIDERKLFPGDYNYGPPGASDELVWSETGCICVLVTSSMDAPPNMWDGASFDARRAGAPLRAVERSRSRTAATAPTQAHQEENMATLDSNRLSNAVQALAEELDDSLLLESLPVGVYVCNADGLIVRYNRAAATLWGREPRLGEPSERFCGSYRLLDLGGTHVPSVECPMAIALATGQSYRDERIQIERPDGSRVVAQVNIEVLKNSRGQVTGAVNVFRDSASRSGGRGRAVDRTEELEAVLQALPAAIYTTDLEGRITFYNEAAAELWGVRPELHHSEFCGSWKLYWPDGTYLPHDQCPMAMALKEGRAIRGKEAVAERPDGTRVPFLAHPTPLFDGTGRLTGAVNMLVDISDRQEAELAAQRLAAIVEFSDDAILSKDLDGIITSWNRGAERLYGYAGHEVLGKPVTILIPEDRQDEEPKILARIRRGERIDHYETMRKRKDGSLVDISLSVSPIVDSTGRIVGASKIARDITDRRRAEEQKDRLLQEMDHRVKNLFALANGMVTLSGRKATSVTSLVSDLQGRFGALARAHSLTIPQARNSETVPVATLHALIYKVTEPYRSDQGNSRVTVIGPDLPIGPATVTNFALLFHEFATNAAKYGALAVADGTVRVECLEEGDAVSMTWREHGKAGYGSEPLEEGFGSRLARATIEGPLGGSFTREFRNDGVEIRLKLSRHRMSE